jgi:hypothetical protein
MRKASALRPTGHPHRAVACPVSCSRHNQSGHLTLLDEAIALHREALTLRSAVHPDRFESACSGCNLATSLWRRYEQTGATGLLDETVVLHRESLDLHATGHPGRGVSCTYLAQALLLRYGQIDNVSFLEEAIALERDALALHPAGHPLRAPSCNNLVASLLRNYKHAGNNPLPVEAPDAFTVLADLWRHAVQPVFDHLQLQVCAYYDYVRSPVLISSLSRRRAAQDDVYTGVLGATLRSSRCMQPASTTGQATEKYAALTMSSPRTLRHCLRCSGHRIRPRRLLLPASTSLPSPKTAAHPARCRVCGTLHRK